MYLAGNKERPMPKKNTSEWICGRSDQCSGAVGVPDHPGARALQESEWHEALLLALCGTQ